MAMKIKIAIVMKIGTVISLTYKSRANMKVGSSKLRAEWKRNVDIRKSIELSNTEKQRRLTSLEAEVQQLKIKKQGNAQLMVYLFVCLSQPLSSTKTNRRV